MDNNTKDVLIATIPAVIGFGASLVVVWRSNRANRQQHFSHRWWERKAQTYSDIMGSLSSLLMCEEEWLAEYEGESSMSVDYRAKMISRRSEAIDVLRLSANLSGFLVSPASGAKIRKTIGTLEFFTDPSADAANECVKSVRACIEFVGAEAAKDLEVARR